MNRRSRPRVALAPIAGLAGVAIAAGLISVVGCGSDTERAAVETSSPPPPPTTGEGPGLDVPEPRLLDDPRSGTLYAPVREEAAVRRAPSGGAPEVGRLEARTPEDTENIVLVEGRTTDDGGRVWARVRLAGRAPLAGWVPRAALGGYVRVTTRLTVDLAARTLTLRRGEETLLVAPVGIGTADAPTPTGSFYIRNKLTRYRSPAYGPVAFGTSAQSPTLTDWPAGGFVGIHGTDRPEILPGEVSHGCIRMRNPDILRLERLLPIGTPLTIA